LFRDLKNSERIRGEAAYLLSWKEVLEELSRTDRSEAVRAAEDAFWEDKPHLAWGAAYLLGAAKDSRAWKTVSAVAASKLSQQTRYLAVYALLLMSDRRAAGTLVGILQNQREPASLRAQAAEALGHCGSGSNRAGSALITALADESAEVRLFSANALAICGNWRAIPALKKLLKDRTPVEPYGTVAADAAYAIRTIATRRGQRVARR